MTKPLQKIQTKEHQYIPLDDNDRYFYTYDLGCSSALISADFELVSLDKANPRKAQFIFQRVAGIEKAVDNYWADHLKVNAREFFDNIKMLKNRIYSE
jgi:hypothetical protein